MSAPICGMKRPPDTRGKIAPSIFAFLESHRMEPHVAARNDVRSLCLPAGWKQSVRSAVVQVVALGRYAITNAHARVASHRHGRIRFRAEIDRLRHEIALLREELCIKDARMACLPAQRRPHYRPTERMAILELRPRAGGHWPKPPGPSWSLR
jgi:hypothetical protein